MTTALKGEGRQLSFMLRLWTILCIILTATVSKEVKGTPFNNSHDWNKIQYNGIK